MHRDATLNPLSLQQYPLLKLSGLEFLWKWHSTIFILRTDFFNKSNPGFSSEYIYLLTRKTLNKEWVQNRDGHPDYAHIREYAKVDSESELATPSQVPQPTCFWTSQSQAGTLSTHPDPSSANLRSNFLSVLFLLVWWSSPCTGAWHWCTSSGHSQKRWLLTRQGPRLTLGSQTGERTPKKAIFQLWRSVSQSKKILHQKAQQNWNQSSMTFKFCQFETILKVSSGHCGPLTPFPQFRHLFPQSGQIYWVTFFNWISPGAANHISPALFLA